MECCLEKRLIETSIPSPNPNQFNPWKWTTLALVIILMINSILTEDKLMASGTPLFSSNTTSDIRGRNCITEDIDSGELFIRHKLSCRSNLSDGILLCLEKKGVSGEYHEGKAVMFINQQQYIKAMNELNKAIALNGGIARYYYLQAKALLKLNRFGSSVANLNKALELEPNTVTYLQERAFAFRKLRRYSDAL